MKNNWTVELFVEGEIIFTSFQGKDNTITFGIKNDLGSDYFFFTSSASVL
jgi:hypothetical protein